MIRRLRARWAPAALMALTVFLLGALAHYQHHLLDPGCDPGRAGESHACACAGFHAGALVESVESSTPRIQPRRFEPLPSTTLAPVLPSRSVHLTRGPPSA